MKIGNGAIFFMILLGIITLVITLVIILDERTMCLNSPLIYGANKITESNDADFSCSCSLNKPNSPKIFFNKDNVTIIKGSYNSNQEEFNLSFIDVLEDSWP